MTKPDIAAAETFLAAHGRIIDRRRFSRMFRGADPDPVLGAVAAYRNTDGGFGHGLEPDLRGPESQPAAVEMALRIMHQADAWDTSFVAGACDWLAANAPADGGATFVEAMLGSAPHAPWWVPDDSRPPSPIQTGMIAGTLHARGFQHPWLDPATELMWNMIGKLSDPGPYDLLGVIGFLDAVPDRARAEQVLGAIAPMLLGVVALDPEAPGEVHSPLEYAPMPDSIGRQIFDANVIAAHLDHLAAAQADDGGWTFNWLAWSPAAAADWRGFRTVEAVWVLRGSGRLS